VCVCVCVCVPVTLCACSSLFLQQHLHLHMGAYVCMYVCMCVYFVLCLQLCAPARPFAYKYRIFPESPCNALASNFIDQQKNARTYAESEISWSITHRYSDM